MDKAELHVHLEGSIEPETLLEIDPALTREEIEAHMPSEKTFPAFIESYIWINRKLQTPEHYALAARRLLQRLREQNVIYAEITLSAGVILWKKGDLAAIYDAVWEETRDSQAFWIPDAVRQFGAEAAVPVVDFAISRQDRGVVAFGIGGFEDQGPAEWFDVAFERARDGGLHTVAHAGETVGPESIWAALRIGAERIGHGISAIKDPALCRYLNAHDIPIEICISSNVCTGVVPSLSGHPVRALWDAGVPMVLNTDDPALFRTTLDEEYKIAANCFGLPVEQLAAYSLRYAFKPPSPSIARETSGRSRGL